MEQEFKDIKGQSDEIIHQFIQGFLDTRKKDHKKLKEINLECQKMVEERMSQKPGLKRLLSKYENDPWIQKILIRYVLLKIYNQSALWVVEDSELKSKKNKRGQYESRYF